MTEKPLQATISQRAVLFGPTDDVLVLRRDSDGGWELPGGRLGSTESPRTGLYREVEEETGLDVDVSHPVHTASWRNDSDDGRFGVYYLCTAERRTIALSGEHTDYEWLAPRTAAERLSETQGEAVTRARRCYDR